MGFCAVEVPEYNMLWVFFSALLIDYEILTCIVNANLKFM